MATAAGTFVTNCATGFSPASVIGANHFQSSGAMENMKRCRNRNCRWSRPRSKTSNRPAPANRPWRKRKIGFVIRTPRHAKRTPCRNGPARAGTTCGSAIRKTTSGSSAKNRSATGWAALNCGKRKPETGKQRHHRRLVPKSAFRNPKSAGRGRSLHRRRRARGAASLVRAVLAQGALRSRISLDPRAVPAPRQSGHDPRRGRPQDVEALGQRDRSARRDRNLRRGCVSLLRDVHGPARADETVEHERRRRRLALSRARLASDHGRKSGRRMGSLQPGAGSRFRQITAQNPARHDQESHRRHRNAFLQHRDLADDDPGQRASRNAAGQTCFRPPHAPAPAQSVCAASHLGALGNPGRKISRRWTTTSPRNAGPSTTSASWSRTKSRSSCR